MSKLIIIGASGHGKVIADIACQCGYTELAFLDDNNSIKTCMGYPIIGKPSEISKFAGMDFFVAIGILHVEDFLHLQPYLLILYE